MSDEPRANVRWALAVGLAEAGWTVRRIAEHEAVQLSKSQVGRVLKRYREEGIDGLSRRQGSGRPLKIQKSSHEEALLKEHLKRENSLRRARDSLERDEGVKVGKTAIADAARRAGMKLKGRKKKPCVTDAQRKQRLEFAREYIDKPPAFWKDWLFTDEKKFFVWLLSPKQWCEADELPEIQRTATKPPQVYVWGGISFHGRTPLRRIEGGLNTETYMAILQDTLKPSVDAFARNPDEWWFQQDSTEHGTHGSLKIRAWLEDTENVPHYCRPWPANSPDLNPIENLWFLLNQKMRRWRGDRTCDNFWKAVQEEWDRIPQETIQDLLLSMPRRLEAVIAEDGRPTKY